MPFKVETTAEGHTRVSVETSADLGRMPLTVAYLKLQLALGALHDVLFELGIGPKYGPVQEALVFSPEQFTRFRDACVDDAALAGFFTLPRRKRPSMSLRRTMMSGIPLISLEELPDHYQAPFSVCRPAPRKKEEGHG